jgi:hypothetical protein
MSLPSSRHDQSQLESYLDRWARSLCLPAPFVHCLLAHGLAPGIEWTTEKGQSVTIRGSDSAESRTWKKFLASLASGGKTYSLDGRPLPS